MLTPLTARQGETDGVLWFEGNQWYSSCINIIMLFTIGPSLCLLFTPTSKEYICYQGKLLRRWKTFKYIRIKLDGIAPLIADPSPCSFPINFNRCCNFKILLVHLVPIFFLIFFFFSNVCFLSAERVIPKESAYKTAHSEILCWFTEPSL